MNQLPRIRTLSSMSYLRRPLRWQMTCYLFLFRARRLPQTYRLRMALNAARWHVSFERPTQADLFGLMPPRKLASAVVGPLKVAAPISLAEPEFEIIPLAPAWRQAA